MIKILPKHNLYDCMSKEVTLLKLFKYRLTIQSMYHPHIVKLYVWKKLDEDNIYVLKHWKHIPFDREARTACKCDKYEAKFVLYRERLDDICNNKNKKVR